VDQRDTIAFLSTPQAHGGQAVEIVETHASMVFLAGTTAYKLKRAVRYDYLDFSTPERRKAMTEAELALNRRTAPSIYQRVVPVTREPNGMLAIGGAGAPVDWLLVMRRFDQDQLLDSLAVHGALPLDLMPALAETVARMHAAATPCRGRGGAANLAWVIDGNARDFAARSSSLDEARCRDLIVRSRQMLDLEAGRLDDRQRQGFVRRCHGDLHLRNIVRLDGVPIPFDAVEFNDDISCIDVLYDLAFLLMDLWRRSLFGHANAVLNAYVGETGDVEGLGLLPLFLSCRAAVRAKTGATTAALEQDEARRAPLQAAAANYLSLALRLLEASAPRLIAVGGRSGSGKTVLARSRAPELGSAPGALVVRSDELRKRQAGVSPLERLPGEAYNAAASEEVYAGLASIAERAAVAGRTVIVDAVFGRALERDRIERVAARARVPFCGLWLDASPEVCAHRVERRRGDASDANAAVVHAQVVGDTPPSTWTRLDASRTPEATRDAARAVLGLPNRNQEAQQ
jgi:aminoglycoside phosphotransferase family enzyme/predicted kinase